MRDGEEVLTYGTNPLDSDTDGDGLMDNEEVRTFGTNPLNRDSDGGGRSDGEEVNIHGTNPLDSTDDRPGGRKLFGISSLGGMDPDSLFEIDLTTGLARLIGTLEGIHNSLRAVTIDPITGTLYALDSAAFGDTELLILDPTTGAVSRRLPVFSFSGFLHEAEALTHDDSGNLYIGYVYFEDPFGFAEGRLLRLDPTTGAAFDDMPVFDDFGSILLSALAFDLTTGHLWGASVPGRIMRIDPQTGRVILSLFLPVPVGHCYCL